jgi:hypothetical protein
MNLAARLKVITADLEGTIVQFPRLEELQQIYVPVFALSTAGFSSREELIPPC